MTPTCNSAALAFVSYWFVIVRVRVRTPSVVQRVVYRQSTTAYPPTLHVPSFDILRTPWLLSLSVLRGLALLPDPTVSDAIFRFGLCILLLQILREVARKFAWRF